MQSDSCNYEFELDNHFFTHMDASEIQKGSVTVRVVVKRFSQTFELNFHTEGVVWIPCDRCLDEMEQPIVSDNCMVVKFGDEYADEGENLIILPQTEGELNVAELMYEFVALAIPLRHVHPTGQCNKIVSEKLKELLCNGEDNEFDQEKESGDFSRESVHETDPRWNELKKLVDNN